MYYGFTSLGTGGFGCGLLLLCTKMSMGFLSYVAITKIQCNFCCTSHNPHFPLGEHLLDIEGRYHVWSQSQQEILCLGEASNLKHPTSADFKFLLHFVSRRPVPRRTFRANRRVVVARVITSKITSFGDETPACNNGNNIRNHFHGYGFLNPWHTEDTLNFILMLNTFAPFHTPPQCINGTLFFQRLLHDQYSPVSHLALVQLLHALFNTLSCHWENLNDGLDLVVRSECQHISVDLSRSNQ